MELEVKRVVSSGDEVVVTGWGPRGLLGTGDLFFESGWLKRRCVHFKKFHPPVCI